jgi:hypothetical protein
LEKSRPIVNTTIATKVKKSSLVLFDFFLRHPMRFDDLPFASTVEPQRKEKIGAVAIIHFPRCIPASGDLSQRSVRNCGVGIDPSIHVDGPPNKPQVLALS